jgi:Rod binding domain-containing protein
MPLRILYAPLSRCCKVASIEGITMSLLPPTAAAAPVAGPTAAPAAAPADDTAALRAVARELEASFLAEMLKHAGFGESRESFGGGAGEEQFASLLRSEHARALADRGGIGLAESLFRALVARSDAADGPGR